MKKKFRKWFFEKVIMRWYKEDVNITCQLDFNGNSIGEFKNNYLIPIFSYGKRTAFMSYNQIGSCENIVFNFSGVDKEKLIELIINNKEI